MKRTHKGRKEEGVQLKKDLRARKIGSKPREYGEEEKRLGRARQGEERRRKKREEHSKAEIPWCGMEVRNRECVIDTANQSYAAVFTIFPACVRGAVALKICVIEP
ncbi:hypothetical protein DBV15_11822 [Temnothorax longispinosus]|uniref:Uncharacterized protein n=1 Tax=Temnothorax longispinosus TaxID=300112 RepID=A0A4S2JT18_9HYME|nr:hypothetical protein DBV15_11822 [Temnothorax longispinosus]